MSALSWGLLIRRWDRKWAIHRTGRPMLLLQLNHQIEQIITFYFSVVSSLV